MYTRDKLYIQGKLVPKLTLGPFLTLSVKNGPNLQSYLFQTKLHHTFIKNVNFKIIIRCEN